MKKFLALIFIIPLLFIFTNSAFAQSQEKKIVKVGVYDNKPKIYYEDETAKGFFAEIVNYIADQEDFEVEYIYGNWNECLNRLENGEIDVMVDVAESEPRSEKYLFNSQTVLMNWGTIYTKEGFTIDSIYDLEGKNIAVMKSGIHFSGPLGIESLLNSFGINVNYIDVEVYEDVFKLLDSGEVDAGVVNQVFGTYNESNYKVQRSVIIFNPTELKFAFSKKNTDSPKLIEKFDKQLSEMKDDSDSVYWEIMRKYIGETSDKVEVFPQWGLYVIISLLALTTLLVMVALISRKYEKNLLREVKEKTKDLQKSEENYKKLYEDAQNKLNELDILIKATVGRELQMVKLKKKLKEIEK